MPDAPNDLRTDAADGAPDADAPVPSSTPRGSGKAKGKGGKGTKARKPDREPTSASGDGGGDPVDPEPGYGGDDDHDDEVRPHVVGCPRCETRVPYGSRYCPTCGVPLVRSGGDAAGALARTRRRTSWVARILAPLVVLAVVAAVLGVAGVLPGTSDDGVRSDLESQLSRVVRADRELTTSLTALRGSRQPADAVEVAGRSLGTIRDAIGRVRAIEPGDDSADVQRVLDAMIAVRVYVSTVQQVLRDPGGSGLKSLGSRSAAAVKALRSTDDVASSDGATGGAARLADNARARVARARAARDPAASGSGTASGGTTTSAATTSTTGG